jgi:hypothetical protein
MFAPPICRRRWRNNAFRSVRSDEDGGNPANIAASGSEQSKTARLREQQLERSSEFGRAATGGGDLLLR